MARPLCFKLQSTLFGSEKPCLRRQRPRKNALSAHPRGTVRPLVPARPDGSLSGRTAQGPRPWSSAHRTWDVRSTHTVDRRRKPLTLTLTSEPGLVWAGCGRTTLIGWLWSLQPAIPSRKLSGSIGSWVPACGFGRLSIAHWDEHRGSAGCRELPCLRFMRNTEGMAYNLLLSRGRGSVCLALHPCTRRIPTLSQDTKPAPHHIRCCGPALKNVGSLAVPLPFPCSLSPCSSPRAGV